MNCTTFYSSHDAVFPLGHRQKILPVRHDENGNPQAPTTPRFPQKVNIPSTYCKWVEINFWKFLYHLFLPTASLASRLWQLRPWPNLLTSWTKFTTSPGSMSFAKVPEVTPSTSYRMDRCKWLKMNEGRQTAISPRHGMAKRRLCGWWGVANGLAKRHLKSKCFVW